MEREKEKEEGEGDRLGKVGREERREEGGRRERWR